MKIVIFGGTGMTGLCALEHAVEKGYDVTAFVRDRTKIPEHLRPKVKAVVGDVTDADQVDAAVAGTEGVVVVLGTRNDLKPTTDLSKGTVNILKAMKTHDVRIVSACMSAFLFYKQDDVPARFVDLNADHRRMYDAMKASDLDWIAVFPPHIADSPASGYVVEHDKSPGRAVSKYDLGAFLVDALRMPEHHRRVCGVTSHQ